MIPKPEEALQLIKNVAAEFRGTFQDHTNIQNAIRSIEMEFSRLKSEASNLVADAEHPANAPEPE